MTLREAKEVLRLYRPGTIDADDAAFLEALRLCESNAELRQWFEQHCEVYTIVRGKLKQPRVPEGLWEQIIAERPKAPSRPVTSFNPARAIMAVLAVAVIVFAVYLLKPVSEDTTFSGYQQRMIGTALRSYGMDLQSDNLDRIRSFLAQRGAIADFLLPAGLKTAKPVGCVATTWQGKPVTMICYRSGKPLAPAQESDLWLFVTDSSSVRGAPKSSIPLLNPVLRASAASWTSNGRTYMLAVDGEPELLQPFLQPQESTVPKG